MMMMTNITGQLMTYNIAVDMFPLFIKSVKEKPWCYNPSGYVVWHKKLCSQWFPLTPYSVYNTRQHFEKKNWLNERLMHPQCPSTRTTGKNPFSYLHKNRSDRVKLSNISNKISTPFNMKVGNFHFKIYQFSGDYSYFKVPSGFLQGIPSGYFQHKKHKISLCRKYCMSKSREELI